MLSAPLPRVPGLLAPPPTTTILGAPLPRTPVWVLDTGMIVYFPQKLQAVFGASSALLAELSGVFSLDAVFSSSSSLLVDQFPIHSQDAVFASGSVFSPTLVQVQFLDASFASSSAFTPEVEEFFGIEAVFASDSVMTAEVRPVLVTTFGSSSETLVGLATNVGFDSSESILATITQVGLLTATFNSDEPFTADLVTFLPSGMTKNGTQAWPTTATYVGVNNWTANTGSFPGSSVDGSHRLVVQGTKTGATITAQAPYTGGSVGQAHLIRCVNQSGTVIGSASTSVTTSPTGTVTLTLTGVDLTGITAVGLQMSGSTFSGTLSSGASTYLTIT